MRYNLQFILYSIRNKALLMKMYYQINHKMWGLINWNIHERYRWAELLIKEMPANSLPVSFYPCENEL